MKTITKVLLTLLVINIATSAYLMVDGFKYHKPDKIEECQILGNFTSIAEGKYSYTKYDIVVRMKKYPQNLLSWEVKPQTYYQASQSFKQNKPMNFMVSQEDIDEARGLKYKYNNYVPISLFFLIVILGLLLMTSILPKITE